MQLSASATIVKTPNIREQNILGIRQGNQRVCPGELDAVLVVDGCLEDVSRSHPTGRRHVRRLRAGDAFDKQVTLVPTSANDHLLITTAGSKTISTTFDATPKGAEYAVEVSPSNGVPNEPVGTVHLGNQPYVCDPHCNLIQFQPNNYTIHGLPVQGEQHRLRLSW